MWSGMNLQEFSERFKSLSPRKQIKFIHKNIGKLAQEDKTHFLLSTLMNKKNSPTVRATAMRLLGESSYQEFRIFHEYLRDSCLSVVRATRKVIKNLEPPERKNKYFSHIISSKIHATKNKEKRLKMVKALAKLKAPWIPLLFLIVLDDPIEEIRDIIIKELGKWENLDLNLFHQRLKKPPWYTKSAVLKILGLQKNPASIKHIDAVLKEPNVDVRRTAAQALGEIGGREAIPLLVKLTKDRNPHVKIPAEKALREVSDLKFTG